MAPSFTPDWGLPGCFSCGSLGFLCYDLGWMSFAVTVSLESLATNKMQCPFSRMSFGFLQVAPKPCLTSTICLYHFCLSLCVFFIFYFLKFASWLPVLLVMCSAWTINISQQEQLYLWFRFGVRIREFPLALRMLLPGREEGVPARDPSNPHDSVILWAVALMQ